MVYTRYNGDDQSQNVSLKRKFVSEWSHYFVLAVVDNYLYLRDFTGLN